MNCTKCGKEIPEGSNKLCEDCQKNLLNDIKSEDNVAEEKGKKKSKRAFKVTNTSSKKNNKLYLVIVAIIIAVIGILVIGLNLFVKNNKVGNTIGNIKNSGRAVEQGGWIYYYAPNEDLTQNGIYKLKQDDKKSEPKELFMEDANILSINVSKNYIYFIGIASETYKEDDEVDNKIYRMKTDGSNLEVINDNEFSNDSYEIYVVNNSIYYIGTDYNIYKMNTDGSNRKLVIENDANYLAVTDKYIVYNVENEDGTDYVTYIMNLDGTNARPILENTRLSSVNIEGDNIYYINSDKQICKVKLGETEGKLVQDTTAYNMNFSGKYIYYLNYADEKNNDYKICLFRVKTDGTTEEPEKIKELETTAGYICVVGDWVTYTDSNETEGYINLVKTDGSDEYKLFSLSYEDYFGTSETSEDTPTETTEDTTEEPVSNETETTNTTENTVSNTDEVKE